MPGASMNFWQWVEMMAQMGILAYFLAMNGLQLYFILRAFSFMRDYMEHIDSDPLDDFFESQHHLPITLICPAYNEAAGVVASVNSLVSLRYPELQVVVVNDGSTDETLQLLIEAFRLVKTQRVVKEALPTRTVRGIYESQYVHQLLVVDKENGGKSDALNCGVNLAKYPLVCCIDGDSVLEQDALLRAVRPFVNEPNTMACGGVVRPLNGCKVTRSGMRGMQVPDSWLARQQIVEYLRAFLFGRVGLSVHHSLFIVSGAFGLFRKELILQAKGFSTGTIGEDFELVVRVHRLLREQRRPYNIPLVPDPICWTEAPETFRVLARQRNRWQRGLMETLWSHRRMLFNPRYGRIGLFSMSYFLLFEALAPVVELTGFCLFVWALCTYRVNWPFAVLFLWCAFFLGVLNSVVSVFLEQMTSRRYPGLGSWARLVLAGIAENFGYRQLTVWWRLRGIVDWLRGKKAWGKMTRKGF
jgi:cellulose synthase/poly-beta-1,6-N-acetylglucosamine synthase-like glycosyltransferase